MSLAPNVHVVPGVSEAVEESEECVGEFSSPVSGKEGAVHHFEGEADDNDSFVDIICLSFFLSINNKIYKQLIVVFSWRQLELTDDITERQCTAV